MISLSLYTYTLKKPFLRKVQSHKYSEFKITENGIAGGVEVF